MEAEVPLKRGRRAILSAKGLVERGARHYQALGNALQGRQPPSGVCARGGTREEAPHEDVLWVEEAGERPLEGVERAWDGREGPLGAHVVGGQRAAHMGEPQAEDRCWVALATKRRVRRSQFRRRPRETG